MLRCLSWCMGALPLSTALAVGRLVARLWFYCIPIRRRVALTNIGKALGAALAPAERRRIARGSFESLAMMAVETLRYPHLDAASSTEHVRRQGFEHCAAAFAKHKGVIFVASHLGNVELLGTSQGVRGMVLNAVVKEIKNPAVHRFLFDHRSRCNIRVVPPRRSKDLIYAALARGEGVTFIVDQHMAPYRAVVCEFFGMLASTSPAPARFAFETGAPVIPVAMFRDRTRPTHHTARFEPELVLETPYATLDDNIWHNTQRLNRIIEGWIREAPDQYLWLHRRFKVHDDPTGFQIPAQLQHLRHESRP
ncbi:MAG: lysophospholipid acyltransferase family protein [Deltaproteobacteria bacterium]|nr:lysophospholipid acyltransferase family protein [Deltaproteobacteria bacterium]